MWLIFTSSPPKYIHVPLYHPHVLASCCLVLPSSPSLSPPLTLHKPSIKPHTHHIHCCPHTHTHTSQECTLTRITADPFLTVPHSTPGYWTNGSDSTPTAIARITGYIGIKDDLCVFARGRNSERREEIEEGKKTDGERKRRVMKRRCRERRDDSGRLTGSSGRREMWKCVSL